MVNHDEVDIGPTIDSMLFAQNIIVNSLTNNPSFIEVFSQLSPPSLPHTINFFCIFALAKIAMKGELAVEIRQAEGATWTGEMQINPSASLEDSVFAAIGVSRFELTTDGQLTIRATLDGAHFFERAIPVACRHGGTDSISTDI